MVANPTRVMLSRGSYFSLSSFAAENLVIFNLSYAKRRDSCCRITI